MLVCSGRFPRRQNFESWEGGVWGGGGETAHRSFYKKKRKKCGKKSEVEKQGARTNDERPRAILKNEGERLRTDEHKEDGKKISELEVGGKERHVKMA